MWAQDGGTPASITATLIVAFTGLLSLMGWLIKHLLTTVLPEQTKAAQVSLAAALGEFAKLREQFDSRQAKLLEHCEAEADKERKGSERRYEAAILEMKEIHQSILNQGSVQSQLLSLIRQRTRLSDAVESAEDAVWTKTLDGIITSWNRAAESLLGWRSQEVIGRSVYSVIPPERHEEERHVLEQLGRGERVERYEALRLHRDGRRVRLSVTISPIKDPAGRVVGISSIAREI